MLIPGALIAGRYRVVGGLGIGGQGDVYEALDTHEGDRVAIKLLRQLPPGGPWVEAQILRRLVDPHVLPIRNADVAAGQPYLVTDLAQHGTLADPLQAAGPLGVDVDDVVRWIRQACHGVARAHALRLLHNDIKPGNLFLNAPADCLVGDFAFASLVATGRTTTTPHGASPETAAPEVAAGFGTPAPTASVQSDVFALGATAYWLLTGEQLHDFSGAPDVAARMAIAATHVPERPRDIAPHLPTHVARTIEMAMDVDPARRFASATDMAAALGRRPAVARKWRRTDEHPAHIRCWRGEPVGHGNTYVLCLEAGGRSTQNVVTARHAGSGIRILRGCRTVHARDWASGTREAIRLLR